MTTPQLFRVLSMADNMPTPWGVCDHVLIQWFVWRSRPIGRYAQIIKDYPPDHLPGNQDWLYAEGAADECFTADQAEPLQRYLINVQKLQNTTIEREPLPMSRVMPLQLIVGFSVTDCGWDLDKAPGYRLPFRVNGYYNLQREGVVFRDGRPKSFTWAHSLEWARG